jgi:hypothetical protein
MPGPHLAQRFLHLVALLPQHEKGYTWALPLRPLLWNESDQKLGKPT